MKRFIATISALGAATLFAGTAMAQPIPKDEQGWVLRAERGSCLAQKGADDQQRFQVTSRGRMLLSAPNLNDQYFLEGQTATLRLVWSDGVDEQVEAASLTLPGGGADNLKPRQVYVLPLETTSLAKRFPAGFTLIAYRQGQQVFTFDGRDAAPFLKAYNECAARFGPSAVGGN